MRTILVVAVHPDDETLGCGGTLLKHRSSGDTIHWCVATGIGNATGHDPEVVATREREIEQVRAAYGFASVHQLGFPTTRLDRQPFGDVVAAFKRVLAAVRPQDLYLPFAHDVHSDHRVAFRAAFSCTKRFRSPFLERVLMMETLSETDCAPPFAAETFRPNVFVDISAQISRKQEILQIYASELGLHPFPRSLANVKALAHVRGATSNVPYAEAFMLLREVR